MSSKRKFRDEDSDSCADISFKDLLDTSISNNDSSDIVRPVGKSWKQIFISDDTNDEDGINHQLPEHWI